MKVTIYSALFGNVDQQWPHKKQVLKSGVSLEYKMFTEPARFGNNHNLNAKIYKVFPERFLNTDVSIWIDGNIQIINSGFVDRILFELGEHKLMTLNVEKTRCIQAELQNCRRHKKGLGQPIGEQVAHYMQEMPCNFGVNGNGMMVRQGNNEMWEGLWWAEICKWSTRDQLSLPYVRWKYNVGCKMIDIQQLRGKYLVWHPHTDKYKEIYENEVTCSN